MKSRTMIQSLFPVVALACVIGSGNFPLRAAEDHAEERAAIKKTAETFVTAFQKGDAKALAAFWTPEGDYVDEDGHWVKGQEAIEKAYKELFAAKKGLKLRIDVASLQFPAPNVAVEDGTSAVLSPEGEAPTRARYANVLVQKDGKWLLQYVREYPYAEAGTNGSLHELDWVIGDWTEGTDKLPRSSVLFELAPGGNFLVSTRMVEFNDVVQHNNTEWIGWDPVAKRIRSWSFQADGGFGEAVWANEGGKWIIKTSATIADGGKVTATTTITPVDANTITLKMTDQTINGKPIPDTKEIKMKRVP